MAMMNAASRNVPVTPATSASGGAVVTSAEIASALFATTMVVSTAPASGMPDVCPSVRESDSRPEATPTGASARCP